MLRVSRLVVGLAVLASLGLGIVACQKVAPTIPEKGLLILEPVDLEDSIPLSYGELKAIHAYPGNQYTAVLWFEKPDKTLIAVRVQIPRGILHKEALTIPRR